jgi:thiamine pyrophosphate-dependent acetolactate synthase large subunit-like protein
VLPFFKVIEESGILPHFTLSHEPAVGFAADAAARYHHGLGVAVVTYGAGAFNLVNAVAGVLRRGAISDTLTRFVHGFAALRARLEA